MKTKMTYLNARLRQTRGWLKETWGRISQLATTNRALGRPTKQRSSWPWIPALGGAALLVGLSLALLTRKTDILATLRTTEMAE